MTICARYLSVLLLLLPVAPASAQVSDLGLISFDTPSKSEWAVARSGTACKLIISVRKGYSGTITAGGDGVIFTALNSEGQAVATATAKGSSLLYRARCL